MRLRKHILPTQPESEALGRRIELRCHPRPHPPLLMARIGVSFAESCQPYVTYVVSPGPPYLHPCSGRVAMTAQDAAAEKEPENAPQEMNYYSVGDGQGIVHWLGRGCGTREWKNPVLGNDTPVRLLASSCAKGELWMITDWKFDAKQHDYQSKDDRRSWVAIDFKNYEVCPAVYSMAHDAPRGKANYLRSWKLQGSNDLKHWTALDTRTNDEVLCSKDPWVAYATPELSSYYQYIRIVMEAEGNTRHNNVLTLNCFEVYGKVRRRKDIPKPVERKPASKPNNSNANGNAAAKGYSKGGKGSKGADFEGKGKGKGRGSGAAAFLSGGILPPWGAGRGDFKGGVKGAFKGGKISARGDMPALGLGLGKGMKGRGSVMLPAANSRGIERVCTAAATSHLRRRHGCYTWCAHRMTPPLPHRERERRRAPMLLAQSHSPLRS